jgi:hypothetical protein
MNCVSGIKSTTAFADRKLWAVSAGALLTAWVVVIAFTFRDYGITWDEDVRSTYGEYIVRWYASGFRDTAALHYFNLSVQGGFFNVLERLARRVSPFGGFETSHLLNAIFGVLAAWGAYRLGSAAMNRLAGFASAVFLIMTPSFYGHSFNNPVDVPTAALWIWALYFLVRMIPLLPAPPWRDAVRLGVVAGLALALRMGSVLLVAYVGLVFAAWLVLDGRPVRVYAAKLVRTFAIVCGVAYVAMLPWWPAAILHPLYQPAKGLWFATHFEFPFDVFFEGKWISNMHLPRYYVAKTFLISLPEFYFVALCAGAAITIPAVLGAWRGGDAARRRVFPVAVIAAAALLPVLYTVIARPVDYDGIRHYLFVVPLAAVLCGCAAAALAAGRGGWRWVFAAGIVASLALTAADMRALHPDEYVYFNHAFGGGLAKAARLYETDYWGNSYKEGVDWLAAHYRPAAGRKIKVASCSYSLSTSYFLPADRFEYVGSYEKGQLVSDQANLFLATTRWNCDSRVAGKVVHVVERQGAPLLYIKEVGQLAESAPAPVLKAEEAP